MINEILNKKDNKSVQARTERIMASSGRWGGGGWYIFQTRIGKGGIIFTSQFLEGVQF